VNFAFSLIVSVEASTMLSMKASSPSTDAGDPSCGVTVTGILFLPSCDLTGASWSAGTANVTKIGSTCAMVISSLVLAFTRLPLFTVRLPVRPSIGDAIVV
jgi:hypothetical protein